VAPVRRAVRELLACATLAACGSSSAAPPSPDGGATHDSGSARDVVIDVIVDPHNCVPPGSADYCSPAGGQCDMAGPGGGAEICTGDLPGTPPHAWYCTLPCDADSASACAGGASCKDTPMGSRCVPESCDSLLPDGGPLDSGSESGSEPAPEGGADAGPKDAETDGRAHAHHDASPDAKD
jgi:hypothetical protein